jgi:hypothetical protein
MLLGSGTDGSSPPNRNTSEYPLLQPPISHVKQLVATPSAISVPVYARIIAPIALILTPGLIEVLSMAARSKHLGGKAGSPDMFGLPTNMLLMRVMISYL